MADANLSWRTNSVMCICESFGFGSNVSMWLGPPSMVRKMQALAFAGWCVAACSRSCCRSAVRAMLPSPALEPKINWRRLCCKVPALTLGAIWESSVNIQELVGIHQHQGQVAERPGLRAHIGGLQVLFVPGRIVVLLDGDLRSSQLARDAAEQRRAR